MTGVFYGEAVEGSACQNRGCADTASVSLHRLWRNKDGKAVEVAAVENSSRMGRIRTVKMGKACWHNRLGFLGMTEASAPSKIDSAGASVLLKKNPGGKTQTRKSKLVTFSSKAK